MSTSNFKFLETEFPILYNIGQAAEMNFPQDSVTTIFKLRQFGEQLVKYVFEEHYLDFPRENNFHNCLKTLEYEQVLPERVKDLLFVIKNKGNKAVHETPLPKQTTDVTELETKVNVHLEKMGFVWN